MQDSALRIAFDAFFNFRHTINQARNISLTLRFTPLGSDYLERCSFEYPDIRDRNNNDIVCFYFDLSDMLACNLHERSMDGGHTRLGRGCLSGSLSTLGSNLMNVMVFGTKDLTSMLSADEVIGSIDPITRRSRIELRKRGVDNAHSQTTSVLDPDQFRYALLDACPWRLGRHEYLPVIAIGCHWCPANPQYEVMGVFLVPVGYAAAIT